MKPLPTAPLTEEDMDLWVCVGMWGEFSNCFRLEDISMASDRRDAALMLRAQYQRQWLPASGIVPALPPWLLPLELACGPVGGQL